MAKRRGAPAFVGFIAASGLAACASGGGGGSPSGPVAVTTPAPAPVPVAVGPSVTSPEFLRSYSVGAINANAAWAKGYSGAGITIAVVDTGVVGAGTELTGRISPLSIDINAARAQPAGSNRHATYVAGVIAANFNNQGSVGVAFDSTILSIRADSSSTACGSDACFSTSDLARGIDYAVANGAKIINLSLGTGSGPAGADFEAALQRAVNAGLVITAAAGNEGVPSAHWPSGYAVDPRYAGSIIAVGALNASGDRATFSNMAGAAGGGFLFAPGESVVTDCNATTCAVVSGTSLAAPQVSGALALVLQGFPNLTGRQAVDLLWRTARDLGAPGNDQVYGWGALDIARAFAPVGTLSVPVAGGEVAAQSLRVGTTLGPAFGDAVETASGLRTVGWDYYGRPFQTNLARAYVGTRPGLLSPASGELRRRSQVDLTLAGGSRLNMTASLAPEGLSTPAARFPWMPVESGRDVTLSFSSGRLGFSAWSGRATGNPFTAAHPDPFTALAQSDHAVRADYAAGRWLVSAEAGGAGERRSPDLLQREPGASYVRVSGQAQLGRVRHSVTFGQLSEPLGPLGAYLTEESGMSLPSRTAFASWGADWQVNQNLAIRTEASVGRTRLQGRFLKLEDAAWSSSWRVSLDSPCAAFGLSCGGLRASLSQPLRVESGQFLARLPDAPSDYFGAVTYSDRRFGAAPSGRQTDLTLSATQATRLDGLLQLDAVASAQTGNRSDSPTALGVMATWRAAF